MFTNKSITIKRISNDMREIQENPLEGIGITSIDNDPKKYVVNIKLMSGPYEGYCVQLLLTIPDNYPIKPPKILIYPFQKLIHHYHHHIFSNQDNYGIFCIDLLENRFMSTNDEHTGWNPSYSISSILLQVQNFLSDPDMKNVPNQLQINKLMSSMDSYERKFIIKDDKGERIITHTWKSPYPPMYFKSTNTDNQKKNENETNTGNDFKSDNIININAMESEVENPIKDKIKLQFIKENLTCYMLKENYIDNPDIILGYPIIQKKAEYGNNKIELYPIPQLLTHEGFTTQTQQIDYNNNVNNSIFGSYINAQNNNMPMKAANNEYFNNWLPIYVDKNHFEKNKQTILNAIKQIKNESTFNASQIFDILPLILSKMIIGMFNGKSIISSAYITCYFHYVLLFKKLCSEFEEEFTIYFNQMINLIKMNDYKVNKRIAPDIGNFFILMFFSNKDMKNEEMKKIRYALFEEYFTRQMYWIFHGNECQEKMKNLFFQSSITDINIIDNIFFDKFENDPDFKMLYLDIFNKELHKIGLFDKVVNIISNDNDILYSYYNNKKETYYQVKKRMNQSFKKLYNECSRNGKDKLRELIIQNMHFSQFFGNDFQITSAYLYNSFNVDKLLEYKGLQNKEEILKYAYESQRGNQLLLTTFFALKRMEESGFMEELEKNFGIFLDVDNFVQQLKIKLNEIKSFKSLYEYIGTDFGKDKTELELIIHGYKRAKLMKYIRDPNEPKKINTPKNNYNFQDNSGNQYNEQYNRQYDNSYYNYEYDNSYRNYDYNSYGNYRGKYDRNNRGGRYGRHYGRGSNYYY